MESHQGLPQPLVGGGEGLACRLWVRHRSHGIALGKGGGLRGAIAARERPTAPAATGLGEQDGDGADTEPGGGDEHGDPDVEATIAGDAEPSDVGGDEADVEDEQQDDAPDVAHPPSQAGDGADAILGGQVVEQPVVIDRGQLEEDIADPQQGDAQPEVAGLGQDEEEGGGDRDDHHGVDAEPQDGPARAVGALAGDRGQQGDEGPGDRQPHAQGGLVAGLVPEGGAGEVDGEDEGGDDRVEGRRPPVPQAPGQDRPGQQAAGASGTGGRGGRRGRR